MFNIASKLILPAIAGIGVVVADIPLDGVMSTIVTAAVILAIFLIVAGIVLGSEKRTVAGTPARPRCGDRRCDCSGGAHPIGRSPTGW